MSPTRLTYLLLIRGILRLMNPVGGELVSFRTGPALTLSLQEAITGFDILNSILH